VSAHQLTALIHLKIRPHQPLDTTQVSRHTAHNKGPVTPQRAPHRRYRAASLLALLAVLAQLWIVQVSHLHLAVQVSNWLQWGEVCSSQAPGHSAPNSTGGPMGMGGIGCAICTLAGTGMAPAPAPVVIAASPDLGYATPSWHSASRTPALERGMRPPAQAPPTALS